VLLASVIALVYFLSQYYHNYWKRLGFKQLNPQFFFGDAKRLLTFKSSLGEYYADVYEKYKNHKMIGVYLSYSPALVVTDPKIVQDIMIRDFSSFHDRPLPVDEVNDPLSGHLFNLPGQKWRDLRVKLSPTFTSGKLKGMLPVIRDCGKVLDEFLVRNVNSGVDVFEFRDLMARYNTNIISSVAFGIDNDCINDPDHIFRQMGIKIFEPNFKNGFRIALAAAFPQLMIKLKIKSVDAEIEDFIFSVVKQTVEHREQKNFSRNDFMQMLIQLKNQGFVSVDKEDKENGEIKSESQTVKKMDMNTLVAQAFVFFIAGFETSSSTLSFALFEIASKPEIQRKIQQELDKIIKSAGPEGLTYEMFAEMKYLECCIDEALRKYPIVPVHLRKAARDYKVTGTDLTIPKDTSILIPVLGFHRDPEIYENPLEFIPERFLNSPNGGGTSEGVFYTPFGDGPRNCIGMRMGKLTTKIGLASILSKFNLELNEKDMIGKELEFHPNQFILTPKNLFNIKISSR